MTIVFVSGRFDYLHSGHVAFLKSAHRYGDKLFVRIEEDEKCQYPAKERSYLVSNVRYVWKSRVSDCELVDDLQLLRPDALYCNRQDSDLILKQNICKSLGIELIVGERVPFENLEPRSSKKIKDILAEKRDASRGTVRTIDEKLDLETIPRPIVFVSGCYDFLHSGHVAFFNDAASYGKSLYVSVGSDANIEMLKHHQSMFPESERLIMVECMNSVHTARICRGSGMLDFESDLDKIKPDIFFVNEDGDRDTKRSACEKRGIEYIVGKRIPSKGLDIRSSTNLKLGLQTANDEDLYGFPWRICLAGGWLDQPWVSKVFPGNVIVMNIKPHEQFKIRSGLATSTRQVGMDLWGKEKNKIFPSHLSHEQLAYYLFGAENPPGTKYISGSQDHLGLMLPGVNLLSYDGGYWPTKISTMNSRESIKWLESVLWLVPLPSRPDGYDPLTEKCITAENVKKLATASDKAWNAIISKDVYSLGSALKETMEAWRLILPNTVPMPISETWCKPYEHTPGYLFSGCGGGFLMVVSESPINDGFQIEINM